MKAKTNELLRTAERAADNIRILAASMVEKARSGHPGGAMGGADFINILYSEYLTYDPSDPFWKGRDRFFLDPGHMAPMLYSTLALTGKFTLEELQQLRQWGSVCPGHPERDLNRGIENSSGPLGQGHVYAIGAAIAAKFLAAHTGNPTFKKETIYTYISDGGIQEEISQGAGRIAGHLGLDNLIMFYDANSVQLSTMTDEVMTENTAMKYRAWGWKVIEINGNDSNEIRMALDLALAEQERPTLIIGRCIMGKGAVNADGSSLENSCKTHGSPLGTEAFRKTVEGLGGNPEQPFEIWEDVASIYTERKEKLKGIVAERKKEEEIWAAGNPEKAGALEDWFAGNAPQVDWSGIVQKKDSATRNASATVLGHLAEEVPNMICASADLANSDKTDGFLKKTHAFRKEDFSGAFFQAGVSELTMACCCIGMSLHGGVIAACGTFFVFSDYMKPAVRMAALMGVPVKFIWTHDAFRVGEDGPTHEPVEQEAQIRLMEKLKNHRGQNSMLVLRPADADETTAAWKMAMENNLTPTALLLSRQNITSLPEGNDYSGTSRGAYIVEGSDEDPELILLASGSEVSILAETADKLRKDGIRTRVVSVPSEGLFRCQSEEYQQEILPRGILKFGLTAGLPVNLEGLVNNEGKIWGMETFGYSAPYRVLDEKLGFTPDCVYTEIRKML